MMTGSGQRRVFVWIGTRVPIDTVKDGGMACRTGSRLQVLLLMSIALAQVGRIS